MTDPQSLYENAEPPGIDPDFEAFCDRLGWDPESYEAQARFDAEREDAELNAALNRAEERRWAEGEAIE